MKNKIAALILIIFFCIELMAQDIGDMVAEEVLMNIMLVGEKTEKIRPKKARKVLAKEPEIKAEQEQPPEIKISKIDNLYNNKVPRICSTDIQNIIKAHRDFNNMDDTEINKIRKEIMQLYMDTGYITTSAQVDTNTLKDGILTFVVKEGYIENIIFVRSNGRPYGELAQVLQRLSFGIFLKGYFLNIKDLDQGLEQINRLSTGNSSIEIFPSLKENYSIITISNNALNRFIVSLSLDNSGSKNTGIYKNNVSINADNLLMVNDNIYFNYSKDIDGDDNGNNNSYYVSLSIPFGYLTFSGSVFNTDSQSPIGTSYGEYISDGSSKETSASIEAVIKRGQSHKLLAVSKLSLKETQNSLDGEIIEVSSNKLTIAS
jgi:hemolysin activation/secretion protein